MTCKLLLEISLLFVGLFIVGSIACLPAYHGRLQAFLESSVWLKIRWWIPIFVVFCALLFLQAWAAWVVVVALGVLAVREIFARRAARHWYVWVYLLIVIGALVHIPLIFMHFSTSIAVHGLIIICFGSVLSDVFAFFAGTYFGKHHLPAFLNGRKSYEGVLGQLIGAWVGVALVASLPEISFHWQLALSIGVASAIGDLINSAVKRRLGIVDWGNTIPGHGGVLDRFASLSLACLAGYWTLVLLGS